MNYQGYPINNPNGNYPNGNYPVGNIPPFPQGGYPQGYPNYPPMQYSYMQPGNLMSSMPPPNYMVPPQQQQEEDSDSDSEEEEEEEKKKKIELETDPSILSSFVNFFYSFLKTIHVAFDECPKLTSKFGEFESIVLTCKPVQEKLCKEYHKCMLPYYDACTNKNPAPFLEEKISILKEIDFKEKYQELTDPETYTEQEIKDNTSNLWDYINEMNRYAGLYNGLNSKLASQIEGAAVRETKKVLSGEKDIADLDIVGFGNEILRGATEEDLSDLFSNMDGLFKAVGGIKGIKEAEKLGVKMPSNSNGIGNIIASFAKNKMGNPVQEELSKLNQPQNL